jgi:DNA-binding MarR family transcriptional regulator
VAHPAADARLTKAGIIADFASHVRAYHNAADALTHAAAGHLGLNLTDHRCLDIIEREGPIAAGDLARAAGLSAKAITTAIDRLQHSGYAQRIADPRDRRRVLVAVTGEGHRRGEEIYAPLVRASRDMLQRYTPAELELLLDYLDRAHELLITHAARLQEHVSAESDRHTPAEHPGQAAQG